MTYRNQSPLLQKAPMSSSGKQLSPAPALSAGHSSSHPWGSPASCHIPDGFALLQPEPARTQFSANSHRDVCVLEHSPRRWQEQAQSRHSCQRSHHLSNSSTQSYITFRSFNSLSLLPSQNVSRLQYFFLHNSSEKSRLTCS